jgi:hypothetical protein
MVISQSTLCCTRLQVARLTVALQSQTQTFITSEIHTLRQVFGQHFPDFPVKCVCIRAGMGSGVNIDVMPLALIAPTTNCIPPVYSYSGSSVPSWYSSKL